MGATRLAAVHASRHVLVLAAVIAFALGSACSGGDATTPVRTPVSLADVLPSPEQVTAFVAGVELVSEQSGPQSKDSAAAGYSDEADRLARLEQWGWLAEERAVYMGPALVAISASRYRTTDGARLAYEDLNPDRLSSSASTVTSLTPPGLGDESRSFAATDENSQGGASVAVAFRFRDTVVIVGVVASRMAPLGSIEALQPIANGVARTTADRLMNPPD